jgi:hypothetical protein
LLERKLFRYILERLPFNDNRLCFCLFRIRCSIHVELKARTTRLEKKSSDAHRPSTECCLHCSCSADYALTAITTGCIKNQNDVMGVRDCLWFLWLSFFRPLISSDGCAHTVRSVFLFHTRITTSYLSSTEFLNTTEKKRSEIKHIATSILEKRGQNWYHVWKKRSELNPRLKKEVRIESTFEKRGQNWQFEFSWLSRKEWIESNQFINNHRIIAVLEWNQSRYKNVPGYYSTGSSEQIDIPIECVLIFRSGKRMTE